MGKQLAIPWQSPVTQLLVAQAALTAQIKAMQAEYATWHREHRKWKKDIVGWKRKQRRIEAILYQLERELPDYRDVATHLSDVIEDHENRLKEHEKRLAAVMARGEKDPVKRERLETEHRKQASIHAEVQKEQEAFRKAYLATMAKVEQLVKRLQLEIASC